jgi:hypothetical protein
MSRIPRVSAPAERQARVSRSRDDCGLVMHLRMPSAGGCPGRGGCGRV